MLARYWCFRTVALCLSVCLTGVVEAQEPPTIPVGLDAYRQWERWPYLRIGQQTCMRSTYDRRGGNELADASHFLYQPGPERSVTLDLEGPGVLNFVRYNHWHGSPWHYMVDGSDFTLRESSTADPDHPKEGATFLPPDLFPEPLAWTWATTRGADLIGVPIPFTRSFRMEYERTHYGTGYYIFSRYVPGAKLSQPLHAWDGRTRPAADVLALISRAGEDLIPHADTAEGRRAGIRERHHDLILKAGAVTPVTVIESGPSMLRALEFSAPAGQAVAFGRSRLRVTWDNRPLPSIDAPLALFFGAGTLYNREGREYLVKAFPVNIRFKDSRVHLACYFPMPFFRSARIELIGTESASIARVRWSVRYASYHGRPDQVGYFHATYRDHPQPEPGHDLTLLDTRDAEGGGDWSGHLVGTSFIFSHNANLGTLEGDPRFFFDDSRTPEVQGTGTEEWGGGGDYWGGLNMTLPFVGHPVGARGPREVMDAEDKIESAYRFLLSDLMPFGRNARIGLEHGGTNESTEHYETVAYWYGAPGATLVPTDHIQIGDSASERAHTYRSPGASRPISISSRFEWGVDHLNGREIYPEETDTGRVTKGTSEFTLALDKRNLGVLLRRKLDYSYPNQRAMVYIADLPSADAARPTPAHSIPSLVDQHQRERAPVGRAEAVQIATAPSNSGPNWRFAGIWYLAGSNSCVFSNPKEETGPALHTVQTSNRRFREDDFLLPRSLSCGRKQVRVRIVFTPVSRPLYPGYPAPDLGWSEMRYTAYCYLYPPQQK